MTVLSVFDHLDAAAKVRGQRAKKQAEKGQKPNGNLIK